MRATTTPASSFRVPSIPGLLPLPRRTANLDSIAPLGTQAREGSSVRTRSVARYRNGHACFGWDRPRVTLTFHPNGCFCGQHSEPPRRVLGGCAFRNVLYAPPVRSSARTSPARWTWASHARRSWKSSCTRPSTPACRRLGRPCGWRPRCSVPTEPRRTDSLRESAFRELDQRAALVE
jgi:hypothetical protein